MESLIEQMASESSGCDVTKRIVRPSGGVRYIRCVGNPIIDNGKLQRIVGTAMDVTEHELLTDRVLEAPVSHKLLLNNATYFSSAG
jgi:PAS domain S-box-containing protein